MLSTTGIRNSMIERGAKVPRKMTTAVAVPMPGHPDKLRNHLCVTQFKRRATIVRR